LGLTIVPRENKNNAFAEFGGADRECCGVFRSGLLGTAVGPFGLQKDIDRLNGSTSNVIGETSPLLLEK